MNSENQNETFVKAGVKDIWHPYGIQVMNPDRFVRIVRRILTGSDEMLCRRGEERTKKLAFSTDPEE